MRVLILLFIFCSSVWAKPVTWKTYSFDIEHPADWKEVKDMFGIPVTILGPYQTNESRPVIQIVPVAEKSIAFTDAEVKKWNDNHDRNSREWIKRNNGKLEKLWPGVLEKRKDGTQQLVGGLAYQLNNLAFIEKIYYLSCPKNTWNFKILINQGSKEFLPIAEKIVGSFKCGK